MKLLRTILPLIVSIMMVGCATVKPVKPLSSPEMHRQWRMHVTRLKHIDRWDIKGRMAVKTADDGGSATFIWERQRDVHRIEMFGPFGGGRVVIEQDVTGAVMRNNKKQEFEAATAEALLYSKIGWHVPFENLKCWLRGIPAPDAYEGLILDSKGRALGFQQGGWEIDILDYALRQGLELPRKVFLKALPGTVHLVNNDGSDPGDKLEVKIVLRRWLIPEI